jgi:hypothetical protein
MPHFMRTSRATSALGSITIQFVAGETRAFRPENKN